MMNESEISATVGDVTGHCSVGHDTIHTSVHVKKYRTGDEDILQVVKVAFSFQSLHPEDVKEAVELVKFGSKDSVLDFIEKLIDRERQGLRSPSYAVERHMIKDESL